MQMVLVMCPIFVSKLLNNTKFGIGWSNKAGIPKFVILWLRYGCGFGNAPYIFNKTI